MRRHLSAAVVVEAHESPVHALGSPSFCVGRPGLVVHASTATSHPHIYQADVRAPRARVVFPPSKELRRRLRGLYGLRGPTDSVSQVSNPELVTEAGKVSCMAFTSCVRPPTSWRGGDLRCVIDSHEPPLLPFLTPRGGASQPYEWRKCDVTDEHEPRDTWIHGIHVYGG